jgi:hypothetical protein
VYLGPPSEVSGYTGIDKKQELGQTKGISALILRRWRTEELSVDLEIAIINLISQIPMSIWLYNDGRTTVASTKLPLGRLFAS